MKKVCRSPKIYILALIALTIFGSPDESFAQETLKATANFQADKPISPDTTIAVNLNRALRRDEKIAVTIEQTDVSGLFTRTENQLKYDATLLPLPIGNSTLTVYLIEQNGNWREISRLVLRVESRESRVGKSKRKGRNRLRQRVG